MSVQRRLLSVVAVAASVLVLSSAVSTQSVPARILVMPFSVQAAPTAPGEAGSARWLGEAAASLLADSLTASGIGAWPREDRVEVFDRLQVPMTSELTRATMIRIGELIGASEVVFGEVRVGESLTVRAHTIRLDTGRKLPDVTETAPVSEMFALFGRVATQIGKHTGRATTAAHAPLPPMPLAAFENYVKGLMAATPAAQQKFLESAMSVVPHDGRVLMALWDVYFEQGLHEKALAVSSAVPAASPQFRRARFSVALTLIELKRLDGAYKELGTLYGQRRSAAVSNALGIVQLRRNPAAGGTDSPAFYFERAANEAPGDSDYLFNLGYARALAGDTAGALLWLREAVRHHAADGDAHLVMAAVLSTTGRTAEAQREIELARLLGTALDVVPASLSRVPPALERMRLTLDDSLLGNAALAAPAQRDQSETARFHLDRGRTLVGEGRDREAVADLRRSIYLAPYEDEPHLLLGRVYQRAGRVGEAIDEFKVAIWCRESPAARIALGSALFDNGDRDAARREFERALVLAPDSADARAWLKRIGGN
ncbi:MAG TPA: tetratricopeptide repeat protein [Vicinamibacterales bacterium]|nr:tetratricopeptide repeat protein [Vicinamibacterales bacterium]